MWRKPSLNCQSPSIKASNKKTKAKPLLPPHPPNPNLSLSCAEAAAGAAWLLSDCTDTCAYAPRCLSALAELRKNLLQLPPTAATNSNNYTQRPTKEDAPTRTTKKEKNPNKQTKYINENLLLLPLFCFYFCLFCFCPAAAEDSQLHCQQFPVRSVDEAASLLCRQTDTGRDTEREREREREICSLWKKKDACFLACSFACLQGSLEILWYLS